jgi:muramoyltetrapeptide carboxypeptidase
MAMIKPPRLNPGDRVGVLSPAGPVKERELTSGLGRLTREGLEVCLGDHAFSLQGYLAGDDEARLQDLRSMLEDQRIRAIFCTRGGYGSMRLLGKIPYDLIQRRPKILVGYSDMTALLLAIQAKTGLVTFHGPMLREASFSGEGGDRLMALLREGALAEYDLKDGAVLFPGKATGPLVGGNLSLLCHLVGTPYLPSLKGNILFLEERGEALYRIDRMLTHLSLAGLFREVAGIVFGDLEKCGDPVGLEALIQERTSGLKIPVATGLPVGHGPKNFPLPLGLSATLDTTLGKLILLEPCVL